MKKLKIFFSFLLILTSPFAIFAQLINLTEAQLTENFAILTDELGRGGFEFIKDNIRSVQKQGLAQYPDLHVQYLHLLGDLYQQEDKLDSALIIAQLAKSIAETEDLQDALEINNFLTADLLLKNGQYVEALAALEQIEHHFRINTEEVRLSICLSKKANAFAIIGRSKEAITAANESLALAQNTNQPKLLIQIYNDLGAMYTNMDNGIEGMRLYLKGYELAKEHDALKYVASITHNLSIIFTYIHQFEQAKKYSKIATQTSEVLGWGMMKTRILLKNTVLSLELNEIDSAAYYLKSLVNSPAYLANSPMQPTVEYLSGAVALKQGKIEIAYQHFLLTKEMAQKNNDLIAELDADAGIAEYWHLKREYQKALPILQRLVTHPARSPIERQKLFDLQCANYEAIGNFQNALKAQQKSKEIQDTIFSLERIGIAAAMEAEYELQSRISEIQRLEIENKLVQQKKHSE